MLIQKIFHVHKPLSETRYRLYNIASYRRQLEGVEKAMITADGIAHFQIEPSFGYDVVADLIELPNSTQERLLFGSISGNIDVAGVVEFYEVRENLTEIVLTIDYQLKNALARVVDSLTGSIDHFLNEQLVRLQTHFDGIGTFTSHTFADVNTMTLSHSAA